MFAKPIKESWYLEPPAERDDDARKAREDAAEARYWERYNEE